MDASQTSTLLGFTLQQGVAVVVLVAVCGAFVLAIRKLFADAKEERAAAAAALAKAQADCREERREDRAELGAHLDKLSNAIDGNTRATERLAAIAGRGVAA